MGAAFISGVAGLSRRSAKWHAGKSVCILRKSRTANWRMEITTNPEPAGSEDASRVQLDKEEETRKEIERLRAAEKFITVDEGNYECCGCGYVYEPKQGERLAGVPAGTLFGELDPYFVCPVCRTPKSRFVPKRKVIAGFADNQRYGFGTNSLTAGQKNLLIFGSLAFFFLLLLSGYALN